MHVSFAGEDRRGLEIALVNGAAIHQRGEWTLMIRVMIAVAAIGLMSLSAFV
jgi:hypothetical protein